MKKNSKTWWYKYCQDEKKVMEVIFPNSIQEVKKKRKYQKIIVGMVVLIMAILGTIVICFPETEYSKTVIFYFVYAVFITIAILFILGIFNRPGRTEGIRKVLNDSRLEEVYGKILKEKFKLKN